MDLTRRICLCVALVAVLAGCASPGKTVRPGRKLMLLGPIGSAATQPVRIDGYDDAAWQVLLLKHVAAGWPTRPDERTGQFAEPPYPALVEYREIFDHPDDLNAYLAVLARTGPASTPQDFTTDAQRLSYYINACNACAVRAALADYPAESVYSPLKPDFEHDWQFQVDGQRVNLSALQQDLWQAANGDVRVLFTLSFAALGSPPLASHPYKPADLFDELDAQVKQCLSMSQFVAVAHEQQQLRLWWRIIRSADGFAAYYEKQYGSRPGSLLNVVMELAPPGQRPSLNKAVGYKIVEVPFDRRLNDLLVRASAATPQ